MKLLALGLMVKNEASSIKEVLEAVKPFVDEVFVLVDETSTDATFDICNALLADKPGHIAREPWRGFAGQRNRLLELANVGGANSGTSKYILMLAGDEYLREGQKLLDFLAGKLEEKEDAYRLAVYVDGDGRSFQPRIIRLGSAYTYVDDGLGTQEYPTNAENPAVGDVFGAYIDHNVSDIEGRFQAIWESQIPKLKSALDEDPNNVRALIFLAQSYEALLGSPVFFSAGERISYAMEAMSLYRRRLDIEGGTQAERNHCRFRYLENARIAAVYTNNELLARIDELMKDDPARPEVALFCAQVAWFVLAGPKVYALAAHAAEVARKAREIANESPISMSNEWKAHLMAAGVAKQMSIKQPDVDTGGGVTWAQRLREHVAAGINAGGSWELFKQSVLDPPAAKPAGTSEVQP